MKHQITSAKIEKDSFKTQKKNDVFSYNYFYYNSLYSSFSDNYCTIIDIWQIKPKYKKAMKKLTEENLGPAFRSGTAALYVYDSNDPKSLEEARKFFRCENKKNFWDLTNISGLQGNLPYWDEEKNKTTGYYSDNYYVLINLNTTEDILLKILPHELTHLAIAICSKYFLPPECSEIQATMVGQLNYLWNPILKEEIERHQAEKEAEENSEGQTDNKSEEETPKQQPEQDNQQQKDPDNQK